MTASKQHFEMIARILRESRVEKCFHCDEERDYHLHTIKAKDCEGCMAPQDHHDFVGTDPVLDALAARFADAFGVSNPRFDRQRFLAACGVESEPDTLAARRSPKMSAGRSAGPVDTVLALENGDLDEDETIAAFQRLIDDGTAWHLQGSYGRAAMEMIESGRCMLGPVARFDAYGNRVPGRHEVLAGTKGSPEFVAAHQDR